MIRTLASIAMFVATVALAAPAYAEKPPAELGEAAPGFELKDLQGQTHKLADFKDKIVVLRFQSMHCPWDRMRPSGGYERMLSPMAKEYAGKDVVFLGINSNKNESVEKLKAYAEKHEIPYPILKDPGNKVADMYGARTTPHMFVIDREGKLRYRGGIEENPPTPEDCGKMDEQYLRPVLDALISGNEVPYSDKPSKGCSIKRVAKG
jgi:peroxiredoxin